MKKSKMNSSNKNNNKVSNMKQNYSTNNKSKNVTNSKENIGFEAKDHSFEYDENESHSFELRDCK